MRGRHAEIEMRNQALSLNSTFKMIAKKERRQDKAWRFHGKN
jgi:hypothetical protein